MISLMKNVLVTGGAGFIGANLVRRLLADGFGVHLLLKKGYRRWRISNILADVCVHSSNLQDKKKLIKILKQVKPVSIFHLAAYGAYSHQNDFELTVKTNIMGTFNLAMAAIEAGYGSFVHVGSSSEYGFKDHAPKEDEALEPNSYYALTKATASMLICYLASMHTFNPVILRPYTVFGPWEEPTRLIPGLIVCGLEGKLPRLVSPTISRDFVYVDDFVDACCLAARKAPQHKGKIYNVSTGIQLSIKDAVDFTRRYLGVRQEPKWGSLPPKTWDTNIWVGDSRKIRKELAWKPRFSFEEGFKQTVKWFKENESVLKYYKKSKA